MSVWARELPLRREFVLTHLGVNSRNFDGFKIEDGIFSILVAVLNDYVVEMSVLSGLCLAMLSSSTNVTLYFLILVLFLRLGATSSIIEKLLSNVISSSSTRESSLLIGLRSISCASSSSKSRI